MQTRNAAHTDLYYMLRSIDPDWVINLPQGFQGAEVGIFAGGEEPINLTINCQAGDQLRLPGRTDTPTLAAIVVREGWNLVFQDSIKRWQLKPNLALRIETFADATPTLIDAGVGVDVQIDLTYRSGDVALFQFVAGQIVAQYDLTMPVDLESRLYAELTLPGNNQFIEILSEWQLVSGTGQILSIPDGAHAAHSRPISPTTRLGPSAIWDCKAGDTLRLVAREVDADGATSANILAGIAAITVPPL